MDKFDLQIITALRELEISAHLLGYEYIKTATKVLHENPTFIHSIAKKLYPAIAEIHGTIPSRVERGIRHALESANSDFITQKKVLGTARELANGEFLATLHESIRVKMAMELKESGGN